MLLLTSTGNEGKLALFACIDEMKFRQSVFPGDQLITEVTILRSGGRAGKVAVVCRVDEKVVAEGRFTFVLVPDPQQQLTQPAGKGA